jgi:hypothetical protein
VDAKHESHFSSTGGSVAAFQGEAGIPETSQRVKREDVKTPDKVLVTPSLLLMEQEQRKRKAPKPLHRITMQPRSLDEPPGPVRWKCRGCGAVWDWSDEAEDSPCQALEFLFDE